MKRISDECRQMNCNECQQVDCRHFCHITEDLMKARRTKGEQAKACWTVAFQVLMQVPGFVAWYEGLSEEQQQGLFINAIDKITEVV